MVRDAVGRLADQLAAMQLNRSGGRPQDAGDEVEHGGLAGAVRADQADDLALVDDGIEAIDSGQAAEAASQGLNLQNTGALDQIFHSGSSTMASTAASAVINSRVPPIVWRGRMETVPRRPSGLKTMTTIRTTLMIRYLYNKN